MRIYISSNVSIYHYLYNYAKRNDYQGTKYTKNFNQHLRAHIK